MAVTATSQVPSPSRQRTRRRHTTVPRGLYRSTEVMHLSGASYRMLDHWRRSGVFDGKCLGSGHTTTWTTAEAILARALCMASLACGGSSFKIVGGRLEGVSGELEALWQRDPSLMGWRLVVTAEKVALANDQNLPPASLVVDLAACAADVARASKLVDSALQ